MAKLRDRLLSNADVPRGGGADRTLRRATSRGFSCAGAALLALCLLMNDADAQAAYRDHAGLTAELQSLTAGSDVARLGSLGTSRQGREIWIVEISAPGGAPVSERPGLLVVGNLEGDHVVGSSHAVEIIRHLLDDRDDPAVRTILDDQVVFVIPRLNPDGAEAMFADIRWDRKGNATPYDDDNDGRTDEDGPEDLNGDGAITIMRVPDPSGDFVIDPDDPRLLKRADAAEGEAGTHAVYWEGTDSDGDGFINEDGPGGVDLNRNFQHAYPYWEADAGVHMVSEIESRALMDFMITHRNIGAILTFGHSDNLVTPPNSSGALSGFATLDLPAFAAASNAGVYDVGVFGSGLTGGFGGFGFGGFFGGSGFRGAQPGRDNDPSAGRRPETTVNGTDREYFTTISEAYREITGIESVGVNREAEGAFFQYGYFQFGVPAFSTQGWAFPEAGTDMEAPDTEDAGQPAPGERRGPPGPGGAGGPRGGGDSGLDARLLAALEGVGVEAFADWTAFSHPTLGEVEIGGFLPYVTTNPPESDLEDLGRRHAEFVVRLAGMLPRVRIVDTAVTAHGGGIFTVEAEIENTGYLPTSLQHGVVADAVQPTTVQIQVDPDDVITGDSKTSTVRRLEGSGNRQKFTWVIRGDRGARVEIRVRAQKGGSHSATVTLS